MKKALITGITGQDGSYLTEFLLKKNYEVHGIKRRSSIIKTDRIDHLYDPNEFDDSKLFLHYGDITDSMNITKIINEVRPDEIYNLSAMSHVRVSFDLPEYTANTDGIGTLRILEAVRFLNLKKTKIYQASTSELFGLVQEVPQKETTPFYPRSPYGVAKLYAYWISINYREAYNIFVCNGILFNHESPRRGKTFVTRKITLGISNILNAKSDKLQLGNLNASRDWGHARDYIESMWMILQQDKPDDFVIATGETHTVREFITKAFKYVGIDIVFKGKGVEEKGYVSKCSNSKYKLKIGKEVVVIDPRFYRPTEVDLLIGDASKAKNLLGWEPKISFDELVSEMMENDLK